MAASEPAPPDFVGVGTQRSGTSWWYRLITQHPSIHHPAGAAKELHYFDGFHQRCFAPADVIRYHEFFSRPAGMLRGEWTPRYAYDFWTPRLLRKAAPETKLLFMVKDPIARYRSGVAHVTQVLTGALPPGGGALPTHRSATDDHGSDQVGCLCATDAASRGLYGQQLKRLMRWFPRAQILVLQYESCRRDPLGQLSRTFAHLGVNHVSPAVIDVMSRQDPGPAEGKPRLSKTAEEELAEFLADDVRELVEIAPEIDLELWPRFA